MSLWFFKRCRSLGGRGTLLMQKPRLYTRAHGPVWPCPPWTPLGYPSLSHSSLRPLPLWSLSIPIFEFPDQGGKKPGGSVPPAGGGWNKLGGHRLPTQDKPSPQDVHHVPASIPPPMDVAYPQSRSHSHSPVYSLFPTETESILWYWSFSWWPATLSGDFAIFFTY